MRSPAEKILPVLLCALTLTSLYAEETLITQKRVGPLDTSLTEAQIIEQFGEDNVIRREMIYEGEPMGFQTVLFPDTPRELIIIWEDDSSPVKIFNVSITREDSVYATEEGIRVGTTLLELEKLNGGEPVEFLGFGQEHGGYFVGFQRGPLAEKLPWLSGAFGLTDNDWEVHGDALIELLSEEEIYTSQHPEARKIPLRLVEITITVNYGDQTVPEILEESAAAEAND